MTQDAAKRAARLRRQIGNFYEQWSQKMLTEAEYIVAANKAIDAAVAEAVKERDEEIIRLRDECTQAWEANTKTGKLAQGAVAEARGRLAAARAALKLGCSGCKADYPLEMGVHRTPQKSFFRCRLKEEQQMTLTRLRDPEAGSPGERGGQG